MSFTKINAAGIGTTETVTVDGLTVINNGSFGGNLTVGGVLTYEDVTNVDSVGLITARNGIVVGSGITLSKDGDGFFTGVVTATSYYGDGSNLSNITSTTINSNADNRLITGSGTANTLNGESALTFDGATLDIDGGSNDTPLILDTSATAGSHLRFRKDGSNVHFVGSGGGFSLGDAEDLSLRGYDNILFATGNSSTERVRISSSGNFGIGSNNPQVLLHIASATPTLRIHDTTNNFYSHISVDDSGSLTLDGDAGNGAGSSRIVFKTDGSEHARITSDGRIGINETSPDSMLHISGGSGTSQIRLQRSNAASNTNDYGRIYFESNSNVLTGEISVARESGEDNGYMHFKTASGGTLTERVRINSSGQVLIGADTQGSADGYTNNFMIAETGGSAGMSIQSYTSASSYTTIALGDRTVHNRGYIEQRCGDNNPMTIGLIGNGSIRFTGKNTSSGNLVERARITSDGLCFHGDTAATNALDDYEEGTYTPTITYGTSDDGNKTYASRGGNYTKIGRKVQVNININLSNRGTGSGRINFSLPFSVDTALDNTAFEAGGVVYYFANLSSSVTCLNTIAQEGSSFVSVRGSLGSASTSTQQLEYAHLGNSTEFRATITYFTAS